TLGTIAGKHDLDLLRDVLKSGEVSEVVASGPPFLLFVTAGSVSVTSEVTKTPPSIAMKAGDAKDLVGSVKVIATGNDGATFVAAIIGPELPAALVPSPTAQPVEQTQSTPVPATGTVHAETRVCVQGFDPSGATTEELVANCTEPLAQPLMHLTINGQD